MNAVQFSGQAILAEDDMQRCRRIADVLEHDLSKRTDLSGPSALAVRETIDRYRLRADLVEESLRQYRGY